ncbi:2OG-Fe(II) oxygenase, partial [Acinetobacter baumannii]
LMGSGPDTLRTDLSVTVFLSPAAGYDGGELVLDSPAGEQTIKLDAGAAVLYPSTFLHRDAPVTRGERRVAVTWVQSLVRSAEQRAILFDL